MTRFLFHPFSPEFSDDQISLIRLPSPRPDPGLGFGSERIWRITLKGSRREIGQLSYRDGESPCVFYFGHIGYHIDPPWRGHHFALRACRLIREEMLRGGKSSVVITCDPDNTPSRKTCEHLGCLYEGTVRVPESIHEKYEISRIKCRYIWLLNGNGERHDG